MTPLPDTFPIFPLPGVLLLPKGLLPLNIFEPRYLAMVDYALKNDRIIGMIQPRDDGTLYDMGCAGRITAFEETGDGRYLVTLSGVARFKIVEELSQMSGFRRARIDAAGYAEDTKLGTGLDICRTRLTLLLEEYFDIQGLSCSWEAIKDAPDEKLITCLAMACPFTPQEKQALLEAPSCLDRAKLFKTLLEVAITAQKEPGRLHN